MIGYKRVFSVMIAAVLLVAACMPSSSIPTLTSETSKPILHLKMWSIATEGDPNHKAVINAVSAYNAKHKDIQIDATYVESESFKTQIQIAIAAGNTPDIFHDWGGGVLQNYIKAGVVREIKGLSGKFRPAALGPSTFDGKHYAIPQDLVFSLFFFNKTLFSQYSVEVPVTWSKLMTACQVFKSHGIVPIAIGNKQGWPGALNMDYLINRIGGQDVYLKATYDQAHGGTFTDPVFVGAWTKLWEAAKAGCFEDGVNGGGSDDAGLLLLTGKAAMQMQGNWMQSFYHANDKEFTEKNIDVLPFPAVEDGKGNPADLMGGTGQAMVISAKAPPEAEAALMEMMTSEQFARDLADSGLIPAATGYDNLFDNAPLTMKMLKMLAEAPSLYLFYGTDMAPELVASYDNVTQQILGLATTPEQAANTMQAVAQKLGNK